MKTTLPPPRAVHDTRLDPGSTLFTANQSIGTGKGRLFPPWVAVLAELAYTSEV